ncbi:DUF4277 domain-containing protein [Nostoc linckia FACHB-391]|uniref:DUF4277 domain-containing protein n=2 Tax=Nostoc TaxID=1177 RepID=A0ABR8IJ85_9NOSO|nr:DUF4277 domain-containing protein [Nostoc linckia FACHB-391]MBD2651036.1 DUF4277 domain-containing protein [Nostoc foliaceum FACHB-393]
MAFGIPHVVLLQCHIPHLKLAYNKILGQHPQEKVSAGQAVKAMILNGLGFVSGTLYMFPKYMDSYACEHLIGEGVLPEHFNDDRLGRVLDQLYLKRLSGIFTLIALAAVKNLEWIYHRYT